MMFLASSVASAWLAFLAFAGAAHAADGRPALKLNDILAACKAEIGVLCRPLPTTVAAAQACLEPNRAGLRASCGRALGYAVRRRGRAGASAGPASAGPAAGEGTDIGISQKARDGGAYVRADDEGVAQGVWAGKPALKLAASAEPAPSEVKVEVKAGLLWPISCGPGNGCDIGRGFPDPKKTGKSAFCQPVSITGHDGTDIGISQEAMNRGVDVLAADDGVVQWVFDGKYDKCPDLIRPDCQDSPVNGPGSHEGKTVCTPLGPFCQGGPGAGQCFWCFAGGNVVVILHKRPGYFATRYDHLKQYSIRVREGEKVARGQVIAQAASAGNSSGPHLHFEVWGKTFYDPVDPWSGPCSEPGHVSLWDHQLELSGL